MDCRDFKEKFGVGSTDIAKRLMDFGFHAPTLSFPVHETLMVEPTESEPKEEMDRFIEAMKTIKAECQKIASGEFDAKDNPVSCAPHPAEECCSDSWSHPYSRELAAYPLKWIRPDPVALPILFVAFASLSKVSISGPRFLRAPASLRRSSDVSASA